jgi:hypothetical protein
MARIGYSNSPLRIFSLAKVRKDVRERIAPLITLRVPREISATLKWPDA